MKQQLFILLCLSSINLAFGAAHNETPTGPEQHTQSNIIDSIQQVLLSAKESGLSYELAKKRTSDQINTILKNSTDFQLQSELECAYKNKETNDSIAITRALIHCELNERQELRRRIIQEVNRCADKRFERKQAQTSPKVSFDFFSQATARCSNNYSLNNLTPLYHVSERPLRYQNNYHDEDEADLKLALKLSMQETSASPAHLDQEEEDEELLQALALSMEQPTQQQPTANPILASSSNQFIYLRGLSHEIDMQTIADPDEQAFLRTAEADWYNEQPHPVHPTNPMYQNLIRHFPFLNNPKLFTVLGSEQRPTSSMS